MQGVLGGNYGRLSGKWSHQGCGLCRFKSLPVPFISVTRDLESSTEEDTLTNGDFSYKYKYLLGWLLLHFQGFSMSALSSKSSV